MNGRNGKDVQYTGLKREERMPDGGTGANKEMEYKFDYLILYKNQLTRISDYD
jgi:hypothetical protein